MGSVYREALPLELPHPHIRPRRRRAAASAAHAAVSSAGNYQVSVWYPQGTNRANNVPYTVSFNGGSLTYSVNQQANGGRWNVLGTFYFAAGGEGAFYGQEYEAFSTLGGHLATSAGG